MIAHSEQDACPQQPTECGQHQQKCTFTRSASMCSSQTLAGSCLMETNSDGFKATTAQLYSQSSINKDDVDSFCVLSPEVDASQHEQSLGGWLEPTGPAATYLACTEMIRHHKGSEQPAQLQLTLTDASPAAAAAVDGCSRAVVVSWLVEVAEEFGLQQESLHAAVGLLDRFLAASANVPRCVLQLVAVGCVFIATKQLEPSGAPPSVSQLVGVAAHSFSASDLLRVERLLLDGLEWRLAAPTPYGCLHLLTQAMLAAMAMAPANQQPITHPEAAAAAAAAAACGPLPPLETVVSLAMYLTELVLLDHEAAAMTGSSIATAALLLATTTLAGHSGAWPLVLGAAGLSLQQVTPALALLRRLHAAAAAPGSAQLAELLLPLKAKFGQDCWCRVAAEVTPLELQQQQQAAAAAAAAAAGLQAPGQQQQMW